jgi:hypothetical protein
MAQASSRLRQPCEREQGLTTNSIILQLVALAMFMAIVALMVRS